MKTELQLAQQVGPPGRLKHHYFLLLLPTLMLCYSCAPIKNSLYQEYINQLSEAKECSQNYTYSSMTSVIGSAVFHKRGVNLAMSNGKLNGLYLGDPLQAPLPIRFAEVVVYNDKSEVVQCGITNAQGDLKGTDGTTSLRIPAQAGTYSIRILARSKVAMAAPSASPTKPSFTAHIAIKQDLYTNEVHYISGQFYSDGAEDTYNVKLSAYARQTDSVGVEGGAFNILNSIYTAYDFVRNNTGTIDTGCLSDKLNVYWKLGFNPNQYAEPDSNPETMANTSYYNKTDSSLFITGGRLGDITLDVTNHFDDFVIIHELAHHIENKCGQLLSPGGNHFLLARIDPRLAWAEGWANFFAASVMYDTSSLNSINSEVGPKLTAAGLSGRWTYFFGSKGFTDTLQSIDNGDGFMFDFTKPGNEPDVWQYGPFKDSSFDKVDPSRYPGEGHFREGSISRGLFKLAYACGTYCTTSTPITFETFWKSMDKITGIGQLSTVFKSSHQFLEKLKSFVEAAAPGSWSSNYKTFNEAQTTEALQLFSDGLFTSGGITRWIPYATPLTNYTSGSCSGVGQLYIEPRPDDPLLTSSNSDQRYSNHFYTLDLNTLNTLDELTVTFAKQNSLGSNIEFDLLLFKEDYFFNGDYSCVEYSSDGSCSDYTATRTTTSDVAVSDRRSGALASKTIKKLLSMDRTKKYLLNIRAYTSASPTISTVTDYSYTITNQGGQTICP